VKRLSKPSASISLRRKVKFLMDLNRIGLDVKRLETINCCGEQRQQSMNSLVSKWVLEIRCKNSEAVKRLVSKEKACSVSN